MFWHVFFAVLAAAFWLGIASGTRLSGPFRAAIALIVSAVAMLAVEVMGSDDETPELAVRAAPDTAPADMEEIRQAAVRLASACPGIARYRSELREASGRLVSGDAFAAGERYGWQRAVELTLEVPQGAQRIPATYLVQGHRCAFIVGNGRRPGIEIVKDECASLCLDRRMNAGGTGTFLSVGEPAAIR